MSKKIERKIIQIIECPDNNQSQGYLTALCNDGSIWFYQGGKWERLIEEIPQD